MRETATHEAARTQRIRLPYLDGLRGLAALTIAVFHAYLYTGRTGDHEEIPVIGTALQFGFIGVPVFIVLSGYVLMLPVVQNDLRFGNGLKHYIRSRARRILPPYYAALALSLLLIFCVPILQQPSGTQWDTKVPVTLADVVSHALLVHNFSADWVGSINGPLWSVAVEWQIYFLMPLVLIPLWRAIGGVATTSLLLVVTFVLAIFDVGTFSHPWLVALFAVGMLAAEVTVRDNVTPRVLVTVAAFAVAAVVALGVAFSSGVMAYFSVEVLAGLLLAFALAAAGPRSAAGRTPRILRVLETKPFMKLGLFSYSIYLIHSPLLGLANLLLLPLGLPATVQFIILTCAVLPAVLAICYVFYWMVERHFLTTRQKQVASPR